MSYWVRHSEDNIIPIWLKDSLQSKCPYCGHEMLNYYNDDCRCTNRKCSNDYCYGFVAARADFARELLNIKGIGFETCLKDAILSDAKSPFDLFRVWNIRPEVTLAQFLRIHCFEGIDSEWDRIIQTLGIYTLDELFDRYDGKWLPLLVANKETLYHNLSFVNLKGRPDSVIAYKPIYTFTIMITGTPNNFASKEHFINTINEICRGKIVVIHQKTKRQSGVDFLIREPGSTTRGKVDAALKGGIPIVTSDEFIMFLTNKMLEINKNE